MVGAIIMAHGDDQGLVLPPRLAPTQAVIVPIWKTTPSAAPCSSSRDRSPADLKAAGVRVKLDDRDELSAGFKFNDWEMRGVPLRIEIGPRDVEQERSGLRAPRHAGQGRQDLRRAGRRDWRQAAPGYADADPGRPCCGGPPSSAMPTHAR